MIRANCRERLTADDFDFIVRVLSVKPSDRVSLGELLVDGGMRDEILDHEALHRAILDDPGRVNISPRLLFYVLCRKVLRDAGVAGRNCADYVASLLDTFATTARAQSPNESGAPDARYVSDMLAHLAKAGPHEAFLWRVHIANHSLFMSGIFSENLRKRELRGAPDIGFYEEMGRTNFRMASHHRNAGALDLRDVFAQLADEFRGVRLALNELASRFLHLDTPPLLLATA